MRIDKYLKVARILKRRSTAKNLAINGRILVNGKVAKASHDLKEGDLVTIIFGEREMTIKVLALAEYIKKEDATSLFEVVQERRGLKNEEEI